ncbi:MAG: hypothetical protein CVT73_01855 [Alphaproteobacteria bacterium HGW-Alphaproteobacteria-12]|nr:MAG: hypothetical protein CVT73_01855 [Alphaproteobacteria bacterium HGW-Alphaproteobacteria-12]
MIESLMLIALGFLVATLFAIIAMQLVWRRAVTLTLRRLENGESPAGGSDRSAEHDASLHSEIERLRDERDRLASANDEFGRENTRLSADAGALRDEIDTLRSQIDSAAAESADRSARLAAVRKELGNIETEMSEDAERHEAAALAPAQSAATSPENHGSAQSFEPGPANEDRDDAHILAGVKAAFAEQAAEPRPQTNETGEMETEGDKNARARSQSHISDAALAARIRALEAGVSPRA